jgi:hypothetical protein
LKLEASLLQFHPHLLTFWALRLREPREQQVGEFRCPIHTALKQAVARGTLSNGNDRLKVGRDADTLGTRIGASGVLLAVASKARMLDGVRRG